MPLTTSWTTKWTLTNTRTMYCPERAGWTLVRGGEEALEDLRREVGALQESLARNHNARGFPRRRDTRQRRNRVQHLVEGFSVWDSEIADALEGWDLFVDTNGRAANYVLPEDAVVQRTRVIRVVDLLGWEERTIHYIEGNKCIPAAMIRQGLVPVSPQLPVLAFTLRTIEQYQAQHLRCPRFGKQAFVRSLCDLEGIAPLPHLTVQFTVAYDLLLHAREILRLRVGRVLGRDGPDWRLKNGCPCCTYRVRGKTCLHPAVCITVDGNDSAKRFDRRERAEDGTPGVSLHRDDNRVAPRDYYLSREFVDQYGKDVPEELLKSFVPDPEFDEDGDGCGDTWENMNEGKTGKSWGMYDETGIFVGLCRHSFVLKICDMVRSGELAKYGLAVTAALLGALHSLLAGYDIGCKFTKWAHSHPILARLINDGQHHLSTVVGAFHGCSHGRGCQCRFLPLYRLAAGLEPFESCESWFSKSNALASVIRYATRFHRQQEIAEYCAHADDFDAYPNLSSLLVSKYKHALEVLATLPALEEMMVELGVPRREVFETWLKEEAEVLKKLSKEPEEETLQMEYFQKLVNFYAAESVVQAMLDPADAFIADDESSAKETQRRETLRRQALERRDKCLEVVQDLERRMDITERWVPDSEEWSAAAVLVRERKFRRALDALQAGVIARLLELTKVNMAGTGYKVRKHIAKALQARSKALRNLLLRYNEAALEMVPPRQTVAWEDIVDYAFLADFDLLRLVREDIRDAVWAKPGARAAMDAHFRILRAEEERTRLNVEIRRLVTYMRDEEQFLIYRERQLEAAGQARQACQVRKLRNLRGRFSVLHVTRLAKLSKLPGFTGSILVGEPEGNERLVPAQGAPLERPPANVQEEQRLFDQDEEPEQDGGDDTDDEEVDGLTEALETIVQIAEDS
ncbi:hypothetical protein HMN09_00922700 [Mycena chlorophos]|uniref:Uncharacterized protein n=1 Tax=Mycena chlorophos TaxID=658473 RepID=A0A8H6W0E2_MYCCL|nr:hypothetical protein HMN09_00922700 [Mycena chlorophos]